jgi:hypothetical protein
VALITSQSGVFRSRSWRRGLGPSKPRQVQAFSGTQVYSSAPCTQTSSFTNSGTGRVALFTSQSGISEAESEERKRDLEQAKVTTVTRPYFPQSATGCEVACYRDALRAPHTPSKPGFNGKVYGRKTGSASAGPTGSPQSPPVPARPRQGPTLSSGNRGRDEPNPFPPPGFDSPRALAQGLPGTTGIGTRGGTHTTRESRVSVNPPGCNERCWARNHVPRWPPKSNQRVQPYARLWNEAASNVPVETATGSVSLTPTPSLPDLGKSGSWRGHE